jgi:hypothetical protein
LTRIIENEERFYFLKKNPPQNPRHYEQKLMSIDNDFWIKIRLYQDRAKFPDEVKDYIWDLINVKECLYNNCSIPLPSQRISRSAIALPPQLPVFHPAYPKNLGFRRPLYTEKLFNQLTFP